MMSCERSIIIGTQFLILIKAFPPSESVLELHFLCNYCIMIDSVVSLNAQR